MATSVTLSSKHQIVVPREAREALGLGPGSRLLVSVRGDGVIEMREEPRDLGGELEGLLAGIRPDGALWPELLDE